MDPKIEKLLPSIGEVASSLKTAHCKDRKMRAHERCVLIAVAALDLAEANCEGECTEIAGDSEDRDIRRLRKLLMRQLCNIEERTDAARHQHRVDRTETAAMDQLAHKKHVDLGQYAHTDAFHGNTKKTEKFAKLMGGGKQSADPEHAQSHNTYAPNSEQVTKIARDIEQQFNSALSHKGKKGLGL